MTLEREKERMREWENERTREIEDLQIVYSLLAYIAIFRLQGRFLSVNWFFDEYCREGKFKVNGTFFERLFLVSNHIGKRIWNTLKTYE